ncbi:MAG: ABC transporter ATP-binding protein [Candidatus Alcyoniella australis]|nr:ABC transporter ATP-binding protein [Candidatus Alcyoniella australis]
MSEPRSRDNIIELIELEKSFGDKRVLNKLSLEIPRGSITILLGRSGGGKSVTLKHIIGLLRPDSGRVLIDGEEITDLAPTEINRVRRKFGVLFQGAALFDSMSVGENVAFPLIEHARLSRAKVAEKVAQALSNVGLAGVEAMWPSNLSGGMAKRVGLARAMVLEPEIILFDEPTSGLDPLMADAIYKLISDTQHRNNLTNFIISHDVQLAMTIADKIALIHEGRIIEQGDPQSFRLSTNPYVRQFLEGSSTGPIDVVAESKGLDGKTPLPLDAEQAIREHAEGPR